MLNLPVAARGGRFSAAELDPFPDKAGERLFHRGWVRYDVLVGAGVVVGGKNWWPDDEQGGVPPLVPDTPYGKVSIGESRFEVVAPKFRPGKSFFRVVDAEPDVRVRCDAPHGLKPSGFLGHAHRNRPRYAPRAPSEREQIQGCVFIAVHREAAIATHPTICQR